MEIHDYIKRPLTIEELAFIYNVTREWAMAEESAYIYDLSTDEGKADWKNLYGEDVEKRCSEISRYWMGGTCYYACVLDKTSGCYLPIHSVSEDLREEALYLLDDYGKSMVTYYTSSILDEDKINGYNKAVNSLNAEFGNLVDFDAYLRDTNEDYRNTMTPKKTTYHWVAVSDDSSYYDESKTAFESYKECYDNMREAVLEKMKWNTEFDEDFSSEYDAMECISYEVYFSKYEITHNSYSGKYVYGMYKEVDGKVDMAELLDVIWLAKDCSIFSREIPFYDNRGNELSLSGAVSFIEDGNKLYIKYKDGKTRDINTLSPVQLVLLISRIRG